ncbi:MAG TPA: protein kinase [Kofleriaceae bacterium]|nr:protein kinase [Kofleriaceae bacterium]
MSRPPSENRTRSRVVSQAGIDPEDPVHMVDQIIDGRYHLTSLVGRGGMGSVFLAQHVTIRRPVALKLLQPSLAAIPELARRFEREAFAIGRIDHPNCVTVLDFGKLDDGSLYLVMEYLDGRPLADAIEAEGRIAARRALHITRHVLRGLGHAHQAGIVHRDVKPENVILVEHDGVPDFAKILDFGIARVMGDIGMPDGEERLTQAGIAFGTPAYMSPEQAVGDPVDPRADLYSVTVMLFEMITGRAPFHASDKLELLGMHATRPPPRLSEARADLLVPPELDDLVATGLAKRPADRHASADDYIAALELCLKERMDGDAAYGQGAADTEPVALPMLVATTEPSARFQVPRPRSGPVATRGGVALPARRGARRALAAAILVVLAAGGVGAYGWWRQQHAVDLLASLKSETAVEAEKQLDQGDPAKTIELLRADPARLAGDAQAQLQLGHAHAARSEYEQALEAYAAALALDSTLIGDEGLRANLRLMSDDDGPILLEAARLLALHGEDAEARARIAQVASHKDRALRHKAFALAEELGAADAIDRVAAFLWDLQQDPTCKGRREAVTRLRALGDPRAVAPLKEALDRPGWKKKGKRRRRINENACLVPQAKDAIRYLASKPAPAAPDEETKTP